MGCRHQQIANEMVLVMVFSKKTYAKKNGCLIFKKKLWLMFIEKKNPNHFAFYKDMRNKDS